MLKDVPENIIAPGDEIKVNRHTSYRAPDSIPAAPSKLKATAAPPAKWIVDTGTGIDIVGSQDYDANTLDERQVALEKPLTLDTAGGDVIVNRCLPVKSNHIGHVRPVVCENSPPALSVGYRCAMQGFGFYWWPWQPKPQFIDQNGKELPIMVQHWVPLMPEDPALVCKAIAAAPAPVKGGIGPGKGSGKAPAKKDEPEGGRARTIHRGAQWRH